MPNVVFDFVSRHYPMSLRMVHRNGPCIFMSADLVVLFVEVCTIICQGTRTSVMWTAALMYLLFMRLGTKKISYVCLLLYDEMVIVNSLSPAGDSDV